MHPAINLTELLNFGVPYTGRKKVDQENIIEISGSDFLLIFGAYLDNNRDISGADSYHHGAKIVGPMIFALIGAPIEPRDLN
ncbi:33767_t:CDS:2 [Gigaspora margarita]|uniref:33767_t:CDS:1 n=1 Tax=Gigaspora margarita TaxID=4874 RepID=A0ABN7UZE9_GIGMA|nr:33767_t:CDS:2 [Gigaspora margarita]